MKLHLKTLAFFMFFLPAISKAQVWKKNRNEVSLGLGSTAFLGELGGSDQVGRGFVYDLNMSAARFVTAAGYSYRVSRYNRFTTNLAFGTLSGDDRLTNEPYRNNRNLHFRSRIVELSGIYEIYLNEERKGHIYNIKGAKGWKNILSTSYIFGGIGFFYFNPQAKYRGNWVNLQPLGTEGQGLSGGGRKYSRFNVSIPMGIGFKQGINKDWRVGLQLGYRKTFTDYIDDVGGNYYDNAKLREARGDKAANLADPTKGRFEHQLDDIRKTRHGLQRGNPGMKDAYFFGLVTVNYTLKDKLFNKKY